MALPTTPCEKIPLLFFRFSFDLLYVLYREHASEEERPGEPPRCLGNSIE